VETNQKSLALTIDTLHSKEGTPTIIDYYVHCSHCCFLAPRTFKTTCACKTKIMGAEPLRRDTSIRCPLL